MVSKMTDRAPVKDPLLSRLRARPFQEERAPAEQHIASIQRLAAGNQPSIRNKRRLWVRGSAAALTCLFLFIAIAYIYEIPGGIADWRYARATGISGTISIPIGQTPEDAVRKFRHFDSMNIIHQEHIDGGVLLFIKRFEYEQGEELSTGQIAGTDLQIEFVRKTWLGWKWVTGGGYYMSARPGSDEALNYMSVPELSGIESPFPIVFGQTVNPTIANVMVSFSGSDHGNYAAQTVDYKDGQKIWFAVLPKTAAAPYGISALDRNGKIVADKTFNDPRDSSVVKIAK